MWPDHSEYAALLRTVLSRPDDDAPRLVLADWLDEHSAPERAEFVRRQCAKPDDLFGVCVSRMYYQTPHPGPPGPCYFMETDNLPIPEWVKREGLPTLHGWFGFVRGFVERVEMSAADWLARADGILASHPVREVRLTTCMLIDAEPFASGSVRGAHYWLHGRKYREPCGISPDDGLVLRLLKAEWPAVRTWHLPPEPRADWHMGVDYATPTDWELNISEESSSAGCSGTGGTFTIGDGPPVAIQNWTVTLTDDDGRQFDITLEDGRRLSVRQGHNGGGTVQVVADAVEGLLRAEFPSLPVERRRRGHSRMPSWLTAQRGRTSGRPPR